MQKIPYAWFLKVFGTNEQKIICERDFNKYYYSEYVPYMSKFGIIEHKGTYKLVQDIVQNPNKFTIHITAYEIIKISEYENMFNVTEYVIYSDDIHIHYKKTDFPKPAYFRINNMYFNNPCLIHTLNTYVNSYSEHNDIYGSLELQDDKVTSLLDNLYPNTKV